MVKYFKTFYFSVNTELIEIILFKTAYRVQLLHYYADKQATKLTSDQCLHIEKQKPHNPTEDQRSASTGRST